MAAKKESAAAPKRTPAAAPKMAPKTAKSAPQNENTPAEVSPEELRKLISEAAYRRAESRGFAPGHELEDWIEAEAEVRERLSRPASPA